MCTLCAHTNSRAQVRTQTHHTKKHAHTNTHTHASTNARLRLGAHAHAALRQINQFAEHLNSASLNCSNQRCSGVVLRKSHARIQSSTVDARACASRELSQVTNITTALQSTLSSSNQRCSDATRTKAEACTHKNQHKCAHTKTPREQTYTNKHAHRRTPATNRQCCYVRSVQAATHTHARTHTHTYTHKHTQVCVYSVRV